MDLRHRCDGRMPRNIRMHRRCRTTELQHVPQDKDAAFRLGGGDALECRRQRCRIGVVGIVDQLNARPIAEGGDMMPVAATGRWLPVLQSLGRRFAIAVQCVGGCQNGGGIQRKMRALGGKSQCQRSIANPDAGDRPGAIDAGLDQPEVGRLGASEEQLFGASPARHRAGYLCSRGVGVDDCRSARCKSRKDRGLLLGDRLNRRKRLQMGRRNGRQDRHIGARQPCQRRNFPGPVHADFHHAAVAVRRHLRQCQRHADMIVKAAFRHMDPTQRGEGQRQHVFGRRLARRTRDGNDFCAAARPCRLRQPRQCGRDIVGDEQRSRIANSARNPRDHRRTGSPAKRIGKEIVTVPLVLQSDEQIAGGQGPRVDRQAASRPWFGRGSAGCRLGIA